MSKSSNIPVVIKKTLAISSFLLLFPLLEGCFSLSVDEGRAQFIKGNYDISRVEMEKTEQAHMEASQKSVASLTWDEAQKLVTNGPYAPMYRDALQGYFYMALDALGQWRFDDAVAALDQMLAVHEQIATQYAEPQVNEMSDEMKERDLQSMLSYLPEDNSTEANNEKIKEKRKLHEEQFEEIWEKAKAELQRTDQYANNGLVSFYNPAALLLAAFLNGFNGNPHARKTAETCLTAIKGIAPGTSYKLWKCLEKPREAFHGKVMVIVATGIGPVLVSHNIDLKGVIGTKVFAFTNLPPKSNSLSECNLNFDPLASVTIQANGQDFKTEVATEMYDSLNAEFQRKKSRMMREQVVRVLIRDVLATATSLVIGYKYDMRVGLGIAAGWFFARQPLLAPDIRCMKNAPWAYQVAFLDIPEDRRLMLNLGHDPWGMPIDIPSSYDSAVVYVNLPGDVSATNALQVLPVNFDNVSTSQNQE